MGRFVNVIVSMIQAARFRPVHAVLPPDSWVEVPGRFRFGVPWPWQQNVEVDTQIVDATGGSSGNKPLAMASAPRTIGDASVVLWHSRERFEPNTAYLVGYTRHIYGNPPRSVRRIRLAGAKAVVIEVDTAHAQRSYRLISEWGPNDLLHGEFRIPAHVAEGYRPHLDTMLATWRWG